MWVLPLKPLLATAGDKGGASGGRVVLDAVGFGSKATWQKITKKGQVRESSSFALSWTTRNQAIPSHTIPPRSPHTYAMLSLTYLLIYYNVIY